jgi:hypothetical protein
MRQLHTDIAIEDGCLRGCDAMYEFTEVSEVLSASIIRRMEAVQTSETSVNSYQSTRRYNPEDSHLRTHRWENLKTYSTAIAFFSYL